MDRQRAEVASVVASARAIAEAEAAAQENQRTEELEQARMEAALREAAQQRLVPVKIRVNGLKMSHIPDVEKFSQAFADKVRATLDLDESQLRIVGISDR